MSSQNARKPVTNRCAWSNCEEIELLNALKDLVLRGWKADNSFKSGYQSILQQEMMKGFPGTDIGATPHINSKIHVWKKDYGSISHMLHSTGFDWNDEENTITVDNDQKWNDFVKEWVDIFGKDRATGKRAETFVELIHDVLDGNALSTGHTATDMSTNSDHYQTQTNETATSSHPGWSSMGNSKKEKRKRNDDESESRFLSQITNICDQTNIHLAELGRRIGNDQELSQSIKQVKQVLQEMEFLIMEEKITMGARLCKDSKELEWFFSLDTDEQIVIVKMMLSGKLQPFGYGSDRVNAPRYMYAIIKPIVCTIITDLVVVF